MPEEMFDQSGVTFTTKASSMFDCAFCVCVCFD